MSRQTRPQPRARAAVVQLPRRMPVRASRFLPSSRSVAIGVVLAGLAAGAYGVARETSVFAVRTVRVEGVPPALAHRVQLALRPLESESLLKIGPDDVSRLATALPAVASVTYDRAFPNTLRVTVEAERPLTVLRRAAESWLVSRRARVMKPVPRGAFPALPRVWIPQSVAVTLGATLPAGSGAAEIEALVPARVAGLISRVLTVHIQDGQVSYILRGGLALRVGTADDLPLKLAVARDILRREALTGYLDVSVPARPVAGANPQLSSKG